MAKAEPQSEPDVDNAHADVGIVCALHREMAYFLDECSRVRKYTGGAFTFRGGKFGDIRVAIVEAGIGLEKAGRATQAMLDAHTPAWVISSGYSGGMQPDMQVGDIVMADAVCDTQGNELKLDLNMSAEDQKRLHVGKFLTTDHIVRLVDEKKHLSEKFGAIAVDMESLAVAQVCKENGTRFLSVRAISDDMSQDLPPEIVSVVGETGTFRVGATLGAMFKRFGSIKDMWRLRGQTNEASQRLAKFLQGVLVQLYEAHH